MYRTLFLTVIFMGFYASSSFALNDMTRINRKNSMINTTIHASHPIHLIQMHFGQNNLSQINNTKDKEKKGLQRNTTTLLCTEINGLYEFQLVFDEKSVKSPSHSSSSVNASEIRYQSDTDKSNSSIYIKRSSGQFLIFNTSKINGAMTTLTGECKKKSTDQQF